MGSIWRRIGQTATEPSAEISKGDDDAYQTLEANSEGSRQKTSSRKQEAASDGNGLDGITRIETDPLEQPREEED